MIYFPKKEKATTPAITAPEYFPGKLTRKKLKKMFMARLIPRDTAEAFASDARKRAHFKYILWCSQMRGIK